jgi:hypothetical protein
MSPHSLYDFEPAYRAAMLAALRSAAVPADQSYDALADTASLPAARIVVEASGFARASARKGLSRQGRYFDNHFSGQLTFTVTTPRSGGGPALHRHWVALIRALCSAPQQPFARLPYQIHRLVPSGSTLTYINEGERDRSELVFDVEHGIPGALMDHSEPAPPAPPL